MPKGIPNKRYTGEFKQQVIETMHQKKLSYGETQRQFKITDMGIIKRWERIYLEEGAEALYIERRGRACTASGTQKGRPAGLKKEVEEDLIAEGATTESRGRLPKKFASLGVGQRATAAEKTVVVTKLRREFPLALLLDIAELPRATYYYHVKNSQKSDKYTAIKSEILL